MCVCVPAGRAGGRAGGRAEGGRGQARCVLGSPAVCVGGGASGVGVCAGGRGFDGVIAARRTVLLKRANVYSVDLSLFFFQWLSRSPSVRPLLLKLCHSHPTMRERFSLSRPSSRTVGARGTVARPASASCCRSAKTSRLMPSGFFICTFLARGAALAFPSGSRESPRMSLTSDMPAPRDWGRRRPQRRQPCAERRRASRGKSAEHESTFPPQRHRQSLPATSRENAPISHKRWETDDPTLEC